MNKKHRKRGTINCLGEFEDRDLEKRFRSGEIKKSFKLLKTIFLALTVIYFTCIFYDCFNIKKPATLLEIFINRASVLFLGLTFYSLLRDTQKYETVVLWLSLCETYIAISLLTVVYKYEDPNFLIVSLSVAVFIIGVFVIPNRMIYKITVSLTVYLSFYILSYSFFGILRLREVLTSALYLLTVIILSIVNSYEVDYYKRIQFKDNIYLEVLSITDPLTGIYNRGKFNKGVEQCIRIYNRRGIAFSLILFDIDDLKMINDKYGHLAGDNVIKDIVSIIKKEIRETDAFFRWGGDEFVILLFNADGQHALYIARRLRELIDGFDFETVGSVTCSFGVVTYKEGDNTGSMLARADNALYRAKERGKNKVELM